MMLMLLLLFALATAAGNTWDENNCPNGCRCFFHNGMKNADCASGSFTTIPNNLSGVAQVLNLDKNNFAKLPSKLFLNHNLANLHKIKMRNSNIKEVESEAFSGMKVLIEIDLSHNNITSLDRDLFRDCERIREISLGNNRIEIIEAGTFTDLAYLKKVELNDCQIYRIAAGSFSNLPTFTTLDLSSNLLSYLDLKVVDSLRKLTSLSLAYNPWKCDCHLRRLRDWVMEKSLYTDPLICDKVGNKDWKVADFACKPNVTALMQEGWILSCFVQGDPPPSVKWTFNGKLIGNHSYTGAEYIIHEKDGWHNLTVRHARSRDNGGYMCNASSIGGYASKTLEVVFLEGDEEDVASGVTSSMKEAWPLIVGVVLGALALIIIVLIVCCCFCKNQRRVAGKKEVNGTVGAALEAEEKTLMSVNPVQKPPRRQETALNTSETELLGSVSLPYNDNGSILGSLHNESQLDSSVGREPDLLAFPGKTVGSPTSKPQVSQFGTLPYARSHSPFSPPAPVVPRSGYVTIPRRPRVPSWTASLSPVLSPEDPTAIVEPVYDNLGPRTTADGSSVLSLNKMDLVGLPAVYKNRPLPQTPFDTHEPRRQSWSRGTPDVGDERQLLIATSPQPSITSAKKVPPNPPPKPKKKPNRLFDDEGEDGTEV